MTSRNMYRQNERGMISRIYHTKNGRSDRNPVITKDCGFKNEKKLIKNCSVNQEILALAKLNLISFFESLFKEKSNPKAFPKSSETSLL